MSSNRCPVCGNQGIPAYHQEDVICPRCGSDLRIYKTLSDVESISSKSENANNLYKQLSSSFMTSYDESGSIGKRYRRQDAIGTPFCITVDDETINNGTVTLRDRDTMEQIVLKVEEVESYVLSKIKF